MHVSVPSDLGCDRQTTRPSKPNAPAWYCSNANMTPLPLTQYLVATSIVQHHTAPRLTLPVDLKELGCAGDSVVLV